MPASRASIERVRYWQGQTLRSRDLGDQLAHDASLRWWHNRAIHNTYGVVLGFGSSLDGEHVVVGPGLAYDCFGRELLSLEPQSLEPPPEEADATRVWRLVVRAASSRPRTPSPLTFHWLPAETPLHPDQGVTLAQGSWSDGEFRLDGQHQPRASRPFSRPHLASGATVHGKTDWREWPVSTGFGNVAATGIQVTVDTAAAGFKGTPCYFASLRGDPWIQSGPQSILIALGRVVEATPRSFVFSLWVQTPSGAGTATHSLEGASPPLVQLGRRQWSVCWLGIEATDAAFAKGRKS